jgi:hypothetical protein
MVDGERLDRLGPRGKVPCPHCGCFLYTIPPGGRRVRRFGCLVCTCRWDADGVLYYRGRECLTYVGSSDG